VFVIAMLRWFVQFWGVDLFLPSVCGGFLGVSSEESDLHIGDRQVPTICAVGFLVIAVFRQFVQFGVP
jgi:hypothetical protein